MADYNLYRPEAAGPWGRSFDDLRREMDALVHRLHGVSPGGGRGVFPPVNLYETADTYILTAELPGVSPDDIEVTLEGSTITLRGERKIDHRSLESSSLHRRERQTGGFRRAFELPAAVDADKVEAAHRNGVLMVRIPKAPEHQPRRISVQAR